MKKIHLLTLAIAIIPSFTSCNNSINARHVLSDEEGLRELEELKNKQNMDVIPSKFSVTLKREDSINFRIEKSTIIKVNYSKEDNYLKFEKTIQDYKHIEYSATYFLFVSKDSLGEKGYYYEPYINSDENDEKPLWNPILIDGKEITSKEAFQSYIENKIKNENFIDSTCKFQNYFKNKRFDDDNKNILDNIKEHQQKSKEINNKYPDGKFYSMSAFHNSNDYSSLEYKEETVCNKDDNYNDLLNNFKHEIDDKINAKYEVIFNNSLIKSYDYEINYTYKTKLVKSSVNESLSYEPIIEPVSPID